MTSLSSDVILAREGSETTSCSLNEKLLAVGGRYEESLDKCGGSLLFITSGVDPEELGACRDPPMAGLPQVATGAVGVRFH